MNKSALFYFFCILFLAGIFDLSAKEVEGYIITKGGEKVHGSIRLTSVHYPTGAISINSINYVPLYVSVFFKEEGKRRFKEYYADQIDGFSFYYQNQQIFFFSIELPIKEWNQLKMQRKFLRLVINGHLILFDSKALIRFGNNYTEVTDYYVSDNENKVFDVSKNDYTKFEDFLIKQLKIEPEFINNQPYKISIRNLKAIIANYNQWIIKSNTY